MKLIKSAAIFGVSVLLATAAIADGDSDDPIRAPGGKGFTKWGVAADWLVFVDKERHTCLIEKFDIDGNAVQIGLGRDGKRAYLGVFTKLPESLRGKGDQQTVKVDVDGKVYTGRIKRAHRKQFAEYSGTYVPAKDMDLAAMTQKATQTMTFPEGVVEVNFDMTGAVEAVAAAKLCQAEQKS